MPKHVADKTRQLSVRVDDQDIARIDHIREIVQQKTRMKPQRSDVVRLALHYGIDDYCREQGIEEGALATSSPSTTLKKAKKR